MNRQLNLKIDVDSRKVTKYNDLIKVGDTVTLSITLTSKGNTVSLSGETVKLFLKKEDNKKVEQSVNVSGNTITCTLSAQATTKVGQVVGELTFMGSNTKLTSSSFTFEVEGAISQEVLEESKDSIETFNKVISTLNEANTLIEQYREAVEPIAGTTESVKALNNIKTYIDTNLSVLQDSNTKAEENIEVLREFANVVEVVEDVAKLKEDVSNNTASLKDLANEVSQLSNPNLLINGDFQVWQRGTGNFNCTNKGCYVADRICVNGEQRATLIATKEGTCLKLIFQDHTANTSNIRTYFEMDMIRQLVGKTLTFSAEYKSEWSDNWDTAIVAFTSPNNASHKITTIKTSVVPLDDGWKRKIMTFTIDSISDNATSFHMQWFRGGMKKLFGYHLFRNFKLEVGSVATPFISRNYGEELALCKRYYQVLDYSMNTGGKVAVQYLNERNHAHFDIDLSTPMRILPTVTTVIPNSGMRFVSGNGILQSMEYTINMATRNAHNNVTNLLCLMVLKTPTSTPTSGWVDNFIMKLDAEIY